MNEKKKLNKQDKSFLLMLFLYACVVWVRYYEHKMKYTNTTLFALCYKYGFISRGFMGSVLRVLNMILPIELFSYQGVILISQVFTALMYLLYFVFFFLCIKMVREQEKHDMKLLIIFLGIFSFPMFVTETNFGRLDIYLIIITLISMMLILKGKGEWLIIPLCAIAMCIHQGFVFTNVNIILMLLFYKAMMTEDKKIFRKYMALTITTFAVVSAFFLYFEFFSHVNGAAIADEIIQAAKMTSRDGKYNTSIINHEILGQDVFEDEWQYHVYNYKSLPCFLLLFLPYIILGFKFCRNVLKNAKDKKAKIVYVFCIMGALTLLPEWIMKVDYGRYVYATVFYYIALIMCLILMGDRNVIESFDLVKAKVKEKMPVAIILLIYPALFMPLYDLIISNTINNFVKIIF